MMRLPTWILAAAAFGCAGNRPPPVAPAPTRPVPPAEGPTRIVLSAGYRGVATLERRDSVILTLPTGSRQVQLLARHARFSVAVDNNGGLRIRLDSVAFRPSAAGNEREAIGTTWEARLDAEDGVAELRANRRSPLVLELGEAVRDLFPAVPMTGVTTGDQWSDTTSSRRQVEIFATQDERVSRWSVGRRSTRNGLLVLPVTRSASYTQLGEGSQGGREMRMSSEGRSTTTYYLTVGGRIDQLTVADSATRLITIPSTRQAVPTVQKSRTVVRFEY